MDVSEIKERLLEAVRKGETIVPFGENIKASVSPQGGVYKVEVTGFHPAGFPHWDETTSVASWEGPEVDEAAQRVVDALAGTPARMMQEEPVVEEKAKKKAATKYKPPPGWDDPWSWLHSTKGEAEEIRERAWKGMGSSHHGCVTEMEGKVDDADVFCGALKAAVEGTGPRYGKKEMWEIVEEELEQWATVEKIIAEEPGEIVVYSEDKKRVFGRYPYGKGKKYANKETAMEAAKKRLREVEFFKHQEADLRQAVNEIESAFMKQVPGGEVAMPRAPWVEKVFDTHLVVRDMDEKYYRVSYTVEKDKVPQFAPRAEWVEVEQLWSPKKEEVDSFWQKEPTARMFLAVAKAYLQRKESEATVWKEGDKRFYLGLVSLPSVKDREGEIVTLEGADFSIALSKKYGYHSGLYIKHVIPQSLVGRSLHERRIGPFWVEFGEFANTPLADQAFRILENDKEGKWRFSIGFITPKKQALEGRYSQLLKFDSTITEVPAQPLTAVLSLMKEGGTTMDRSESIQKLMAFLNPQSDDEKTQVNKMLSELFALEEKEFVAIAKASAGVGKVRSAIDELEDEELQKALNAALDAAATPAPAEKKKKEPEPDVEVAINKALEPVLARLTAIEASVGTTALQELREALLTRSKDYVKPSETAPPVVEGTEILKQLEKMLNPASVGKHPLAGMAGGPAPAEGG